MPENIESLPSVERPFGHVTDYAERDRQREIYVSNLERICREIDADYNYTRHVAIPMSSVARHNGFAMVWN